MAKLPFAISSITLAILAFHSTIASGQVVRAPLDQGFERTSSISMTVDELLGPTKTRTLDEPILGPGYPDLWIAEVQIKSIRLMKIELPDPKSGELKKEIVRYMVWRAIRRDPTEVAGPDRNNLVQNWLIRSEIHRTFSTRNPQRRSVCRGSLCKRWTTVVRCSKPTLTTSVLIFRWLYLDGRWDDVAILSS